MKIMVSARLMVIIMFATARKLGFKVRTVPVKVNTTILGFLYD